MAIVGSGWRLVKSLTRLRKEREYREADQYDPYIELVLAKNGQWFWRLVAHNGEILCHSETYVHKAPARIAARKMASRMNYKASVREG